METIYRNINYGDLIMSSPNYHEVLALAREVKENERLKLILEISKTMNDVLILSLAVWDVQKVVIF